MSASTYPPESSGAERAGGVGSPSAGIVRVTTFRARAGHEAGLIEVAAGNAREAVRAPGCRSADVCLDPDAGGTVLVVSRWESEAAARAFLRWHEALAHRAVSPHADGAPRSVHFPVVDGAQVPGH